MTLKVGCNPCQQFGGCKLAIQYSVFEIQGLSQKERWRFLHFQFIFQCSRVNQKLFKQELIVFFIRLTIGIVKTQRGLSHD